MDADRDRFIGCLLGLAVGDAVGFPVEHSLSAAAAPPAERAAHLAAAGAHADAWWAALDVCGPPPQPPRAWPFGQVSDDTQLAIALAASLAATRGAFDGEDFAARLLRAFGDGEGVIGAGDTTRVAVGELARRGPAAWRATGGPSPSNGGAMRVAPLGLVLARAPPAALAAAAAASCAPTHAHPEAAAAAAAVAAGVAHCARAPRGGLSPADFVDAAVAGAAAVAGGARVAAAVAAARAWLALPPDAAAAACAALDPRGGGGGGGAAERGGVSGDAAASAAWAVWAFAAHAESLPRAVLAAVRGGGDTDTTAAMAGAFAGAYLGRGAVPAAWAAALHDFCRPSFGAAALAQLADELLLVATK
jgi:ADP-ribosylglycohydrolase